MNQSPHSKEEIIEQLDTLLQTNKQDIHAWLVENLLTKHEVLPYTNQSEYGLKQSVRDQQFLPFFSKGEGRAKINLFLKEEAILYGKNKRTNVLKGTKR